LDLDDEAEQSILRKCLHFKMPVPDRIRNAPELLPGLEMFYRAFHSLSTCRPVGMGVGAIPWTAVHAYGTMQELDQLQFEALEYHIGRMDSAYLEWSHRKNTPSSKK
jgi:hypothetical protein